MPGERLDHRPFCKGGGKLALAAAAWQGRRLTDPPDEGRLGLPQDGPSQDVIMPCRAGCAEAFARPRPADTKILSCLAASSCYYSPTFLIKLATSTYVSPAGPPPSVTHKLSH